MNCITEVGVCVCLVSASDTMDGTWERYANNQRRAGGHDVLVGVSRIDDHRTDVSIKTFGDPLLPGATWFAVTLQRMFVGKHFEKRIENRTVQKAA